MKTKSEEKDVRTEEQKHYEHTKNFFYWAIGISGGLIAIIAGVSLYFTYNNMKDYKDELRTALSESKSDIKEMVSNANTILRLNENPKLRTNDC